MDPGATAERSLELLPVFVDELPVERRERMAAELTRLTSALEQRRSRFNTSVQLEIILASDLDAHIARVEERYGNPPSRRIPYGTVGVKGITLSADARAPLRVSILLQQDAWTVDDAASTVLRCFLALHEMGHVVQQAGLSDAEWTEYCRQSTTNEEALLDEAHTLWGEFDADLFAMGAVVLTDGEGRSLGAGDFFCADYARSAAIMLERMLSFAKNGDGAAPDPLTGFRLVRETFRILAHVMALASRMQPENLESALRQVREAPGCDEFLQPELVTFQRALRAPSRQEAEQELVGILSRTLERLGIG